MTRLSPIKPLKVFKGLRAMGFEKVRQKGSHAIVHHQDCRRAPIPIHPTKTISPYLLSDILKRLEVDEDSFLQAIRRG